MKVPKAVQVLGEVYQVEIVKGLADNEGIDGQVIFETKTMQLDAELLLNPPKLQAVFDHELEHIFQQESGLAEILDEQARELIAQTHSKLYRSVYMMEIHPHLLEL